MPYAPTVTPRFDWSPVPRIEVGFFSLASGTQAINVYRQSDGRTMRVRGGVNLAAPGAVSLIDFEAPNGVPSSYRAEMFSDAAATVSLGFTDPGTTTLAFDGTCLHQPLDPSRAARVDALQGTAATIIRKVPGEAVTPEGAEVPTMIGGIRQGVTGVDLIFLAQTIDAANNVQSILGGYGESQVGVMCVRTPPPMRIPRTLFAGNFDLSEEAINVHAGGSYIRYTMSADEVAPPAAGLVRPSLRRMDLDAAYATRAARNQAYLTRYARDGDFSLAGLAG